MLIAIDHGNKQMKTPHKTFSSGLCESATRPPFEESVLFYGGKYYTLSEQRIPYMRDKTIDERFFILSLFAIAFELKYLCYPSNEIADIKLAVGLPPAHYGTQYQKFERYFLNRGLTEYELDGTSYRIFISGAMCFPQAYAAVMPVYPRIQQLSKAIIIDIGGFKQIICSLKMCRLIFLYATLLKTALLPSTIGFGQGSMPTMICC